MRQIFVAEKNIASWILWSWTSFTENTSQRKLFFSSWILPFCYESFTSGNPLFPVLEISASFKWRHAFESSNSPYFTLLLGLTQWNSQWLPPLASLLSCHKGILSCCVILLWVSMCFPVWIGFVSRKYCKTSREKRNLLKACCQSQWPLFPNKEEKGKNQTQSHHGETTSQSALNCVRKRTTISEEDGVTPWLLVAASFSMGGKCYLSFNHKW